MFLKVKRCYYDVDLLKNCILVIFLKLLIRICFSYIEFDFKICNNIYIYVFCVYYICNLVINVIEGVIIIVIVF